MEFFKHRKRTVLLLLALFIVVSQPKASFLETTNNKALFQLQAYKEETAATYKNNSFISASLVNLNSNVNSWYVLSLTDKNHKNEIFNLLSISDDLRLRLDADTPELLISGHSGDTFKCNLEKDIATPFRMRRRSKLSYFPVCNNLLFITIKQDGFQSINEKGAEVLRWLAGDAGEKIISGVKGSFFKDRYLIEEQMEESAESPMITKVDDIPPRAAIDKKYLGSTIPTRHLGLKTEKSEERLLAGQWYPLKNYPDVYASMITPGMVSHEIQTSHRDRVKPLDSVEKKAVVYLISFNLGKYTLGWGHGTDHPGVGWSSRAVNIVKDNPYGPDGFNRLDPLIPLGHVPPFHWSKTIGTISGGFQNRHSAFRWGELSKKNKAHHYGFMEHGVMLVSPSEGLATVIIYKDGRVELKRWAAQDNENLPHIKHLRQNGVPVIHRDQNGRGIPGKLVKHWGPGNWSGSAKKQLRTARGAACLMETPQDSYFVYAYFSGATPSAIARVFQAYGCNFALQLDLNSPGQTYASLFTAQENGSSLNIELLMTKMHMYMGGSADSPRYLIKPDYKDFFYIMKKE